MAYLNGKWLARDERQREIDARIAMIAEFNRLADAGVITPYEIDQWETVDAELEKLQRVHDCEFNLLRYMYEYFSEDGNPGNPDNLIPAGQKITSAAQFHRTLCDLLDDLSRKNTKTNVAWSVGRGHAKTAYLSNGFLCQKVTYRHKRYIVEISETTDVAGDFIQWTANQLKHNQKLRDDFGELLHIRKSMNDVDNKYEFVTTSGTKVEAKGIGTQMRGLRHGSTRPDLFLLDDLESKDSVNTPELREKNKRWFREEMLPALSREGICVYMGTIVHYDSVLNYVIKERKDFISKKFPAIIEWSKREDLWEEWRRLRREDSVDAAENARAFYEANKDAMTEGTVVLWPERFSYLDLMEIREDDGVKAFNQEYLGNPIDEESQVFKPDDFVYFTESDIEGADLDYYCGIDFAMGKEKGDYSAIITVGRSPNGVFYVVDAVIERIHPDVLLDKAATKIIEYQCAGIAIEAQQAQEWFAHKLKEELRRRGYPANTRVKEIKQRMRKSLRIESLLPDIQNGKIRFKKQHRLLLEMFELYPNHNNDDGPDALHMAVSAGMNGKRQLKKKPRWM
ncbi:phage terminase large subunit [Aneurinibacillus aneurinilyticus]|jgi:predicted phage terminase large subunit-like protein|uniref:phage terminase large subunit n=1 Tax=Aneurinibacillus aneurinilyticus TaxID=1391 RepID=UPI00366E16B8